MSDDSAKQPPKNKTQNQQQQSQFEQQQQQFLAMPDMGKLGQAQSQSPGWFAEQGFFARYRPPAKVYDEVFDESQNLRPQWNVLNEELMRHGATGMERRWKQIRRMFHQNGIAYSAYGDPSIRDQHLKLDPLPHLITTSEWKLINEALEQKAELLNLMLADLYGPRTLLTRGVLPADILFTHPHYHLPYHGLPTPGGKHFHFYAAEVIRSPKGDWWIKSDRSGSPGGSGFALENRIAISRAFPDGFRRCNVQRLAPFFIAFRDNLTRLAKTNKDNPHVAILSAGAGSARYFEDSFLARYLGFTLVESSDLVVRSGSVMLKTLAGLAPIDVIFRRQHSNSLDPLELGGGSAGIPGILQVIRDENVVVVNAPGSGLVESPIFMAFMPRICQALMNTDLKLPGIATWWGGEAKSLDLMLDRIDELHLVPAFRERTVVGRLARNVGANNRIPKSLQPETMSRQERIDLLRSEPTAWVGQEKVARSTAAVWKDGDLQPGYISMRTFLTATEKSWHSLPGGLVRISPSPYESLRNPFEDGGTKDAWVLSDEPVEPTSLLKKSGEVLRPIRGSGFLPSRIADNLFWLGRYLERAAASARLLRSVASRLTGDTGPDDRVELPNLIRALALSDQIDVGYAINEFSDKLPALETFLPLNALNHNEAGTLSFQVDQIVILASTVRDRLSSQAWRTVQEMSSSFKSNDAADCDLVDLLDIIDTLVVGLASFSGFVSDFMTRTHAFHFLNCGRRLEHALQITDLIENCFGTQKNVPDQLLEAVLEISDSVLTYRSRYYANLQLPAVLDLLLVDLKNPRSLSYQLRKLGANLDLLPRNPDDVSFSTDSQLAIDTLRQVQSVDVVKICELNEKGEQRTELIALLESVNQQLPEISTSISNRFFVHSGPVQQMIVDPPRNL
ncbi:MAG: circularly permuted type 2 ATP-grasp protein [Mariniblastus sp.]